MHNLTKLKQPLPHSTENIQIVEVSNKTLTAYKSLPLPFHVGPIQDNHSFLLINFIPVNLLGWDFLEKYHAAIFFSQKGEIILELNLASISPGTTEDLSMSLTVLNLKPTKENNESLTLLEQVPEKLWSKSHHRYLVYSLSTLDKNSNKSK